MLILFGKNDADSFVLVYHDISENTQLTTKFFEYQIKYFLRHNYKFVSHVAELNKPKRILLTFDDAYSSFANNVLPILERYEIPCILFVPTGYLGKKLMDGSSRIVNQKKIIMSKETLKKIAKNKLITVGCHSHSHSDLITKDISFIKEDISKSIKILRRLINEECKFFCYPRGKVNKIVITVLKTLGFKYAFITGNRSFKYCKNYLKIPRYCGDYFLNKDFLDLSRNSNCNRYMEWFA